MKMNPYVDYQEDILLHLSKHLPIQQCTILDSFWPSNNWKLNYVRIKLFSRASIVDSKDLVIHSYCGPKSLKLVLAQTLFRDLNNGEFFLVKPHDLFLVPVWLGKGSNSDEHLYEDYWNGKWKCNLADPKQWFEIVPILFSFPSWKNTTNKSQITILDSCSSRMKVNLEATNATSNL